MTAFLAAALPLPFFDFFGLLMTFGVCVGTYFRAGVPFPLLCLVTVPFVGFGGVDFDAGASSASASFGASPSILASSSG